MWNDDVVKLAKGKLLGAYLIDVNRYVYACSMDASYEAHWLYTVVDGPELSEDDGEDLYEIIDEADCQQELVSYFSIRSVTEFAHDFGEEKQCGFHIVDKNDYGLNKDHVWVDLSGDYDDYEDLLDELLEACHANHYV